VTFMVTELGLTSHFFRTCAGSSEAADLSFFTRGENIIVTPSKWAQDRIVDYGFPRNKVIILPHAVDRNVFYPIERSERLASRAKLGIGVDEVVFLNIGGAVWNKGEDILVRAFAAVRDGGVKVRLLFKDQKGLYGSKIENVIREVANTCPEILKSEVIGAISIISENLSGGSLRELYSIADCYVSPYRAEGFNLPVLEAIACGLPVIVTKGGATDDFCSDHFAIRISGEIRELAQDFPDRNGTYIEPSLDELIKAMSDFASGKRHDADKFSTARLEILNRFSWPNAARQLASLLTNTPLGEIEFRAAPLVCPLKSDPP
jgi:glycosyltransferase involved in cell wall biosynthesis